MEENKVKEVGRKPRKCPVCGGKVVRILYGEPSHEAFEAADRGELILGGCCIWEESPDWECLGCHQQFRKEIKIDK